MGDHIGVGLIDADLITLIDAQFDVQVVGLYSYSRQNRAA
jgi:hypothetical protein